MSKFYFSKETCVLYLNQAVTLKKSEGKKINIYVYTYKHTTKTPYLGLQCPVLSDHHLIIGPHFMLLSLWCRHSSLLFRIYQALSNPKTFVLALSYA